MNVLLVGSGGREHALAWKLSKSPLLGRLFVSPGNAGIFKIATHAPIDVARHNEVVRFCRDGDIGLVIVGPEAPLVDGLSDTLRAAGIPVFGPSRAAARLESSKAFTKAICDEKNIPTAAYRAFSNAKDALSFVREKGAPLVVKADGLAAGKGVFVCSTLIEAEGAVLACFDGAFGEAGASIIVEELLEGEEVSFFALCDGIHALPLASAQDYKRAFEADQGPNTGGMGAVSPAPNMTNALSNQIMREIVLPTLEAMSNMGTPFQGVLYAGLMITKSGPKLIEYNVRFGDPECQVLMLRLQSDLLLILLASTHGELPEEQIEWTSETAIAVVMAAKGYPGPYETGTPISRTERVSEAEGEFLFHAGTLRTDEGTLVAKGGRVLDVCGIGESAEVARERAYNAAAKIVWPEGFYRPDIGWRSLNRPSVQ